MAIAHVQTVGASGENVSSITTADITTTSGNLLHADETDFGTTTLTVTDSKSNTWLVGNAAAIGSAAVIKQDYAKNITGGASHNFTLTPSVTGYPTIAVTEISGLDTTAPKDQNSAAGNAATAAQSSGNITTTVNDEILCGAGSCSQASGSPFTIDPDYTQRFNQPTTAQFEGLITGTRIVSATETNDFVFDPTGTQDCASGVVSYKIATATGRIAKLAGYGGGLVGEAKGLVG